MYFHWLMINILNPYWKWYWDRSSMLSKVLFVLRVDDQWKEEIHDQ